MTRFWVPRDGLSVHVTRDKTPTGRCEVPGCDVVFFGETPQERIAHMVACAERHEADIEAARPANRRLPIFQPDAWDRELDERMFAKGREMLAEGRMVAKKVRGRDGRWRWEV